MMQYCSKMEYGGRPPSSLERISHLAPTTRRWSLVINPPYLMEHRIGISGDAVQATSGNLLLHAR